VAGHKTSSNLYAGGINSGANLKEMKSSLNNYNSQNRGSQIGRVHKTVQKSFRPLRDQGRLGAAIINDNRAYMSNQHALSNSQSRPEPYKVPGFN